MSKTRWILVGVCAGLIAILISLIIAGSVINCDNAFKFNSPTSLLITNTAESETLTADDGVLNYDKIFCMSNNSSKQKAIISIFSGASKNKPKINRVSTSSTEFTFGEYVLDFKYDDEQVLKFKKYGYVDEFLKSRTQISYNRLKFSVNKNEGWKWHKVYVLNSDNTSYTYFIEVYANFDDLADNLFASLNN